MGSFFFSLIGGSLTDWVKHKQEIQIIKEKARAENVAKGIPGYSDEFLLLVWSFPMIASFIPYSPIQQTVIQGFQFLKQFPEWYVGGFVSITFAVFGIDKIFRLFKK